MRRSHLVIAGAAGAVLGYMGWRAAVRTVIRRESRGRVRSTWVRVNGLQLHVRVPAERVSPSTVPVVLVHGAVIATSYMIPLLVRLAPEFPVFAPDLPGHGESEADSRVLSVPELADVLVAFLDAVGLERAALVGQSMGAQVVTHVAARHPERVDRLVLVGPTTDPAIRTSAEQIAHLLADGRHERHSLILLESQAYFRAGMRRSWQELQVSIDDHIEDVLPRVSVPTLVVRGERDPLVSQAWAEEVARLVRADHLIVVPEVGHAVQYSAPDVFVREIRRFLLEGQAAPEARAVAMEAGGSAGA